MSAHSRKNCGRWPVATVVLTAFLALAVLLTFLVAACGSGSEGTTSTSAPGVDTTTVTSQGGGTDTQVIMTDISYNPATLTVNVGDTVTWVNDDAPQHDVVADNGEFNSGLFDKGESFSFTFTTAGTYAYHCSIHPGMEGTVVVQ